MGKKAEPKKLQHVWLWLSTGDLKTELEQLQDEGRDVSRLRRQFNALIKLGDERIALPANQAKVAALLDAGQRLPMRRGYAFTEPSDLAGIRKLRPRGPRRYRVRLSPAQTLDHLHGAWLGRCAGCLLGKPIEGVPTDRLWPFLQATGQYPLAAYMRFGFGGKVKKDFADMVSRAWFDKMNHMPVDDDTNYTTTGVLIVAKYGPDFAPADVATFWMENIPLLCTCTAERVAYRNLAMLIQPPASGPWRNPYREWIGAQIRADGFGYVNLGNPERAAEFAWRDACISHVKNGIYGETWAAAMIAAAPFEKTIADVIRAGLSEVPRTSRLHRDVSAVLAWRAAGVGYDEAVARIHTQWNQKIGHHWCHTNSNAMIVTAGLLWGDEDFGKTISRAVQPCFDTDCNGATAGSVLGMRLGAKALPRQWTGRLHDKLETSLMGHNVVKISQIARETLGVYEKIK